MNHIITRISDGLELEIFTSPNALADVNAYLTGIASHYGGVASDYQYQSVSDAIHADIKARRAQGKAVYLNGDTVTEKGAPALTLATLPNGDVQITCDTRDILFAGEIAWECTSPDGVTAHDSANAVDGVDTWDITPGQIGEYAVRVTILEYGFAEVIWEED